MGNGYFSLSGVRDLTNACRLWNTESKSVSVENEELQMNQTSAHKILRIYVSNYRLQVVQNRNSKL